MQSRSKKEVEALLQGTLGNNNNAYLEKKKNDVLRQTKIKLDERKLLITTIELALRKVELIQMNLKLFYVNSLTFLHFLSELVSSS